MKDSRWTPQLVTNCTVSRHRAALGCDKSAIVAWLLLGGLKVPPGQPHRDDGFEEQQQMR